MHFSWVFPVPPGKCCCSKLQNRLKPVFYPCGFIIHNRFPIWRSLELSWRQYGCSSEVYSEIAVLPWRVTNPSMAKIGGRFVTSRPPSSLVQRAFPPLLLEQLCLCESVVRSSFVLTENTKWRRGWHLNRRGYMLRVTIPCSLNVSLNKRKCNNILTTADDCTYFSAEYHSR